MADTLWSVSISGSRAEPDGDKLTLIHHGQPPFALEIAVPGLRSAGEDQRRMGRAAIHDAATALQAALASPSALPGFRPD